MKDVINLPPLPKGDIAADTCPVMWAHTDQQIENYAREAIKADRQQRAEQQPTPDVSGLVEALELIAESCDVGRHDGLSEEGPALCATESWLIAKDALAAHRKGGEV